MANLKVALGSDLRVESSSGYQPNPKPHTPDPKHGAYKTVNAMFWPWLSDETPGNRVRCSLLDRKWILETCTSRVPLVLRQPPNPKSQTPNSKPQTQTPKSQTLSPKFTAHPDHRKALSPGDFSLVDEKMKFQTMQGCLAHEKQPFPLEPP